MTPDITRLIDTVAARIESHVEELTALESAIGDGDHGFNMQRGFRALRAQKAAVAGKTLPEALKAMGMTLMMEVGGAAGPIYGTLFQAFGKALPADPKPADLAPALNAAITAVKARGKAEFGQKTLLDVLGPVAEALAAPGASVALVRAAAEAGARSTVAMLATRGRASFLGERSIGHMDPGSRSSTIIIEAICDTLEEART